METTTCGSIQNVQVDRISNLPDDLLIHILSFLSTKKVVQTCLLSKRWRRTWAAVPVLDININDFMVDDSDGGYDDALIKSVARFDKFVNGVVDTRGPTHMDRVHVRLTTRQTNLHTVPMHWLDRVMLLMPRHMCIFHMNRDMSLDLPDSVFSCASLQLLTIYLRSIKKTIVISASMYLPSLKVLQMTGVELHHNFAQKLLIGCPSLEMLYLKYCDLYFSSISSNVLKTLTIVRCHQYEQLQISCPNLLILDIQTCFGKGRAAVSMRNMTSLRKATIHLFEESPYSVGGQNDVSVPKLLNGLSNVIELELFVYNRQFKEQLEKNFYNCGNFNNLKVLRIESGLMSCDLSLIPYLLKLSPNIEKLSLSFDALQGIQEEPIQDILGCVSIQHEYIETVEIYDPYMGKLPTELINTLMKALDRFVKKIGNLIIS